MKNFRLLEAAYIKAKYFFLKQPQQGRVLTGILFQVRPLNKTANYVIKKRLFMTLFLNTLLKIHINVKFLIFSKLCFIFFKSLLKNTRVFVEFYKSFCRQNEKSIQKIYDYENCAMRKRNLIIHLVNQKCFKKLF